MNENKPAALLMTAPGCPHCAGMKQGLQHLLDEGVLSQLEIVDISQQPERAEQYNVRSVPWCELGRFELAGAHTETELRQWAERATRPDGMLTYLGELLGSGQLATAERVLRRYPDELPLLLTLMQDSEQSINVHIGVGALFESLQGEQLLAGLVEALGKLSRHAEVRVRGDACHYLALAGDARAIPYLEAALQDANGDVREIAAEGLELLGKGND
ncbi:MAG: HEAT repeat domain-containing protein [Granulosicoccaceae bacterium]|jgi:thioredoxin-like negative regulator of GroEL